MRFDPVEGGFESRMLDQPPNVIDKAVVGFGSPFPGYNVDGPLAVSSYNDRGVLVFQRIQDGLRPKGSKVSLWPILSFWVSAGTILASGVTFGTKVRSLPNVAFLQLLRRVF